LSVFHDGGSTAASFMPHRRAPAAKALLANPDIGVTQIAHRLGVSPATLYRCIPAARTANTPGV
jgi:DNA-binding MurR/RpiR family transcriptional regulator